jgi:hypothetical protein
VDYGTGDDVDVRGVFDNEVTLPWAFCLSLWGKSEEGSSLLPGN